MQDLKLFIDQTHFMETREGAPYNAHQLGANIWWEDTGDDSWKEVDIVLVGCGETRGQHLGGSMAPAPPAFVSSADAVREELYSMYYWHDEVKIADLGNIRTGATLQDTRAALLAVLEEIYKAGKTAVILGGSHDLTLQQYDVYKRADKMAIATVADMLIDLDETEETTATSFLMDMLTYAPNFIKHYNHIGFQSYYAHPDMVETLDKLRFDPYRLGRVRERIEEMEPVLRSTHLFSLDMNVVRQCDAPANTNGSPNGLDGEEVCRITRYAGMSDNLTSFGIYGYNSLDDANNMTARLIAQMLWYFVDGCLIRKSEAKLTDTDEFILFNVAFTDSATTFLKSKRTNRWWMKLPTGAFVPCSYNDYLLASQDQIPERWLREQERLM